MILLKNPEAKPAKYGVQTQTTCKRARLIHTLDWKLGGQEYCSHTWLFGRIERISVSG